MDVKLANIHKRLKLATERGLPPDASGINPHVVERLLGDSSLDKYSHVMEIWKASALIFCLLLISF